MDVFDKATTWRAEIGAETPAVDRAVKVLADHHWSVALERCWCPWEPNWVTDRRNQHDRHVAEQLAAAGLLTTEMTP